jgi:hypothetical protein
MNILSGHLIGLFIEWVPHPPCDVLHRCQQIYIQSTVISWTRALLEKSIVPEIDGLLPRSQESATGPRLKPDVPNPQILYSTFETHF